VLGAKQTGERIQKREFVRGVYSGGAERHADIERGCGVNLMGVVTWSFEFEAQPYFEGYRELATNGIDKPY